MTNVPLSQAARIMACKVRHPNLNSVEIAKLVGATPHYVRIVMARMGERECRKKRLQIAVVPTLVPKRFTPTVFGSCTPRRSTYTQLI